MLKKGVFLKICWLVFISLTCCSSSPNLLLKKIKSSSSSKSISPSSSGHGGKGALVLQMKGGIALLGEYYADFEIGVPGQKARLQVDTGSSSLIVTAKECMECSQNGTKAAGMGGAYDFGLSGTAQAIGCGSPLCGANTCSSYNCRSSYCSVGSGACCAADSPEACGFFLQYGGDTDYHVKADGDMIQETISAGGRSFPNVTIYRTLNQQGPWPSSVDGIFGLGYPRLNCNPTCNEPVYDMMLQDDQSPSVFSMCMGDESGVLVLGSDGTDEDIHIGPVHYVPVLSTGAFGTYYSIGLNEVMVGRVPVGSSIPLGGARQAIVDSGTTLLLLESDLWDAMKAFFQSRYCKLPGICSRRSIFDAGVCLTEKPVGFPSISFTLSGGLRLELPPSLYFIAYSDNSLGRKVYCLGIQPAGHERTVLGDTLMRGYTTVFDLDKRRVGFSRPNRTTCGHIFGKAMLTEGTRPQYLDGASPQAQASALALGLMSAVLAAFSQIILCARATRDLKQPVIVPRTTIATPKDRRYHRDAGRPAAGNNSRHVVSTRRQKASQFGTFV